MPQAKPEHLLMARIEDAAQQHFGGKAYYLAVPAFGGMFLERHLEALQGFDPQRLTNPETVRTLLEISKLVDCVQDGSTTLVGPERDAGYLSERFQQLADQVEFARIPMSAAQLAAYDRAMRILYVDGDRFVKQDDYDRFCRVRTDFASKQLALLNLRQQLKTATGTRKENLEFEVSELQEIVEANETVMEALDNQHGFSAAEAECERAEAKAHEFPPSVQHTLDNFDLFKISDPASQESHVQCNFFPGVLASDNWTRLTLEGADLEESGLEVARLDGFESLENANIDSIEAEIQILSVERQWFWPELFGNRLWRLPEGVSPVSDGAGGGQIPAFIDGLVFARDIAVSGTVPGTTQPVPLILIADRRSRPVTHLARTTPAGASPLRAARPLAMANRRIQPLAASARPTLASNNVNFVRMQPQPVRPPRVMSTMLQFRVNQSMLKQMRKIFTVKGRITAPNGQPIGQAKVTLRQIPSGKPITRMSDADGHYSVQLVGGGNTKFEISRSGFKSLSKSFIVNNQTFTGNFRLQPMANTHELTIRFTDFNQQPFVGDAAVLIRSLASGGGVAPRREHTAGASEIRVPLSSGAYDIVVTSPGARQLRPERSRINLNGPQTITIAINTGLLLKIEETQLIGFVCQRLSQVPNPEPAAFG